MEEVGYKQQLQIARDTLKMNPVMIGVMGGMTLAEAEDFMKKRWQNPKNRTRYEVRHEDAGKCIRCPNPRSEHHEKLCDACIKRNAEYVRKHREKKAHEREQAKASGTIQP